MQSTSDLIELFEARARVYLFFSQVFLRELPNEAILAFNTQTPFEDSGNSHMLQGHKLIKRFFAFCENDVRTQLACEYARIFLAAGVYTETRDVAVPYESVFTSPGQIMMQEARDEVCALYACDGFKINPDLHEPEDHLGFEFEYLASMSVKSRTVAEAGDTENLPALVERQSAFVERHLLNWLPALIAAAQRYARTTFYIGMLLIAQGYLEEDLVLLNDLADELTFSG
jgi:TorA maturation chaperone TorD